MTTSDDQAAVISQIALGDAWLITGKAGTGKTRLGVLIGQRFAQLCAPWQQVLYLTYSKLAKRQIRACILKLREENLLDEKFARRLIVHNFHSLWWELLSHYWAFLGVSRTPLLCTESELSQFAERELEALPSEILPPGFLTRGGRLRSRSREHIRRALAGAGLLYFCWGSKHFGSEGAPFKDAPDLVEYCARKVIARNRLGEFSHAETVEWAYRLFRHHPNALHVFRARYPAVVVDEFQDTDVAQWEFLKLLRPVSLVVLADPAQTIYRWRGADPSRLDQFAEFCQASGYRYMTRTLTTLHRAQRDMSQGDNIHWIAVPYDDTLPAWRSVPKAQKNTKFRLKKLAREAVASGVSLAILTRTNKEADEIARFLRSSDGQRVMCDRLGVENSPFEAAREICLALLSLTDVEAVGCFVANRVLGRVLPKPPPPCGPRSRGPNRRRWEEACRVALRLREDYAAGLQALAEYCYSQEDAFGCYCDRRVVQCISYVAKRLHAAGEAQWRGASPWERRAAIEAAILAYENAVGLSEGSRVAVMTIHQSKGREFDWVAIPWFTEIAWDPAEGKWDMGNPELVRLFYTACTRARERVFVLYPRGQRAPWPPP